MFTVIRRNWSSAELDQSVLELFSQYSQIGLANGTDSGINHRGYLRTGSMHVWTGGGIMGAR